MRPRKRRLAVMRTMLTPPFAIQYDNKRQGTINLNTLAEFPVWAGLMQGHLNNTEFTTTTGTAGTADQLSFENFLQSRRGYASTATTRKISGAAPLQLRSGDSSIHGSQRSSRGSFDRRSRHPRRCRSAGQRWTNCAAARFTERCFAERARSTRTTPRPGTPTPDVVVRKGGHAESDPHDRCLA